MGTKKLFQDFYFLKNIIQFYFLEMQSPVLIIPLRIPAWVKLNTLV